MELERLKEHVDIVLEFAIETIKRGSEPIPMVYFIHKDEAVSITGIDPKFMDTARSKDALAARIQARVDEGDIDAVIFVADSVGTELTEENDKLRARLKLDVYGACELGLGELRESVIAHLSMPGHWSHTAQDYKRRGKLIELGERRYYDSTMSDTYDFESRFVNFFRVASKHA
jgi:hypothetical protein